MLELLLGQWNEGGFPDLTKKELTPNDSRDGRNRRANLWIAFVLLLLPGKAKTEKETQNGTGVAFFYLLLCFCFLKDVSSQGFSEYCFKKPHSTHILSIRIHSIPMHAIRVSIQYVSIQYVSLHITASAGIAINVKLKPYPCICIIASQEWQPMWN